MFIRAVLIIIIEFINILTSKFSKSRMIKYVIFKQVFFEHPPYIRHPSKNWGSMVKKGM